MTCTVHMNFSQQMPYFPLILQFLAVAVVYNLMTYQSSGNPVSFYKTYPEFFFLLWITWQTVIGNLSPWIYYTHMHSQSMSVSDQCWLCFGDQQAQVHDCSFFEDKLKTWEVPSDYFFTLSDPQWAFPLCFYGVKNCKINTISQWLLYLVKFTIILSINMDFLVMKFMDSM